MLNAGLKLPASTGSDWFISSANRVYAYTGEAFDYESWVQVLKGGRTFITNGPALFLSVEGRELGAEIDASPGDRLSALVRWQSHYPIHRVELIFNGNVVAHQVFEDGSTEGHLEGDIAVPADGWMAARLSSDARDSFFQPVFAHTSPIYVKTGLASQEKRNAASSFNDAIEGSLEWVRKKGRFYTDGQRQEVVDLFREGQEVYRAMMG